jgi:hypothetical protein
MKFWFLLMTLCCQMFLHGGIESSLIQCKHKKGNHKIDGVNFIYMINLKKNLNKFREQKEEFNKYNIVPYRFNAQDPNCLTYNACRNVGAKGSYKYIRFDAIYVKKNYNKGLFSRNYKPKLVSGIMSNEDNRYFHPCMDLESISRNIDYLSIINDAFKNKYKVIWIMDDTVTIKSDPNRLQTYIYDLQSIDTKWDILYTNSSETGISRSGWNMIFRPDVKFKFPKPHNFDDLSWGMPEDISLSGIRTKSPSILISKKGINKILSYYKRNRFFIPFSTELTLIPKIRTYSINKDIVTSSRL